MLDDRGDRENAPESDVGVVFFGTQDKKACFVVGKIKSNGLLQVIPDEKKEGRCRFCKTVSTVGRDLR